MNNLRFAASVGFIGLVSYLNAAVHEMFPQEDTRGGRGIAPQAAVPGSAVVRSRVATQAQRPALPAVAEQAAYPFFVDVAYTTTVTRVSRGFGNAQIVEGAAAGTSVKSLTIHTPGGVRHEIYGTTNGLVYVAASLPDGTMMMREFDPSLEPCHCGNGDGDDHMHAPDLDPQIAQAAAGRALQAAGDVEIDLMMAFDTRAATWAQSNAGGAQALANSAVARMNTALANSGITCVIRLVDVYLPNFSASTDLNTELYNAKDGVGGWSGITARRTTYGADVVSVMIDTTGGTGGSAGLGFVGGTESWMYSACAVNAVNTGQTMTHEIGHNFGCGHSWTLAGTSSHPYAYGAGLNFIGTNGIRYHTIMAYYYDSNATSYAACNLFSSPSLSYQGTTIGDPATADNARVIRERMATVAAFRLPAGVIVTLDPQLGTVAPATIRYLLNETYGDLLPIPDRTGYSFDGWATSTGTLVGPADTVAGTDHTLYAQWTPIGTASTVTFDAQGGTVTPSTKAVYSGTAYDTLPVATRSGHLFAGWYTAPNGGGTQILSTTLITATANHTLYAKWTPTAPGATIYYVDGATGSDSAPGTTPAAPTKTIQEAITRAKANDAILVFDGIYAPITTTNKTILIQSVNGPGRAIIDGGGSQRCATLAVADTDTSTVLTGFTLRNGRVTGSTNFGGGSYGGTVTDCVFTGNYVSYHGGGSAFGIINRCKFIGNDAYNFGGGSYYGTINNSLYIRNTARYGGGAYEGTLNNCTIIDNIATVDATAGGGTRNSTVRNSIVWGNTATGIGNNCSYGSITYTCTTPRPSSSTNTDAAPLFADAEGRLAPNSPCKDTGSNSYAFGDFDLDGNPRTQGGTVDMGAYEIVMATHTSVPETPVPVEYAWINQYYTASTALEYINIATNNGLNGIPVWQSYVACLDPTNPASKFVVTGLTFTNGMPYFTWEPNRSDIRDYIVYGKTNLTDATPWFTPTNNATRFFRVKVLLK